MNEAVSSAVSLNHLVQMAHGWLEIFDNSSEIVSLLLECDISAFLAYQDHLHQFSPSLSDLEIHRRCYIEYAKQNATMASVLKFHPRKCRGTYYQSKFLEELRTELAMREGFISLKEWHERYRSSDWNIEPDPLLRAKRRTVAAFGQEGFEHFNSMYRDVAWINLEREATKFPPPPDGSFVANYRVAAFIDVSMFYLSPLGFNVVRTNQDDYGALDLKLINGHTIRWSIGEKDSSFSNNDPAIFQPTLTFRGINSKGRIKDASKNTRILEFPVLTIVEGVAESYLYCQTLNELKAAMFACSIIIKHSLKIIVSSIERALFDSGTA